MLEVKGNKTKKMKIIPGVTALAGYACSLLLNSFPSRPAGIPGAVVAYGCFFILAPNSASMPKTNGLCTRTNLTWSE